MSSSFEADQSYVEQGMLKLKLDKAPVEESDDDSDDDSDGSDGNSDGSDESEHSDEDSHEGSGEDSDDDHSNHGSDHSDDESPHESDEEPDFHVLPPPKSGTLDSAIEKTSRVLVTMVRTQLENFSESMSQHLMPH